MDFTAIVGLLFEGNRYYGFHDAIVEACNTSHTKQEFKQLFYKLPLEIQTIAMELGLSDTVFRDEVFLHVKQLGENNGKS